MTIRPDNEVSRSARLSYCCGRAHDLMGWKVSVYVTAFDASAWGAT